MSEALRNPQLVLILRRKNRTRPFAERRRGTAQINGDVEHLTLNHANQLPLRLLDLIVQTTEYVISRSRVIVLHKFDRPADSRLENTLVKALEEKTSIISKHVRL